MPELKLSMLPDRRSVKLAIVVSPDLHRALGDYAAVYAQAYGIEEPIGELIPAMLAAFLEGDRAFARLRKRGSQ